METSTPTRPNAEPARRRVAQRPVNASGFELWTWYFMRVSGLILVFLVIGHFAIMHVFGGGIDRVNFAFVSGRWSNPFWQTYDGAMLVLALLHGGNGMRVIVDDYVRPSRKSAVKGLLYGITGIMLVLGLLIIVTFDPYQGSSILGK